MSLKPVNYLERIAHGDFIERTFQEFYKMTYRGGTPNQIAEVRQAWFAAARALTTACMVIACDREDMMHHFDKLNDELKRFMVDFVQRLPTEGNA